MKTIRSIPAVVMAAVAFLAMTVSSALAVEVTLDAEDKRVLKTIADMEKAAGMTQTVLAIAPLVSLVTSDGIAAFTFNFVTTDFVGHANAISAMDKIKSCSISDVITIHLLDMTDPAKTEFFEAIQKPYAAKC